jgi:hypothetical protein
MSMSTARTHRRTAASLALAALLLLPAAPRAAGAQEEKRKVPLATLLKGTVVSFDGSVAEVRYDLDDPAQLQDFVSYRPFVMHDTMKFEWYDDSLHMTGTGGVAWKPVLRRRIEIEYEARMKVPRDFGVFLAEDRVTDHLAVFSIYDQFFQNKDNPGSKKSHMICRMLPDAPDSGGDRAFRYVARSSTPDLGTKKPFKVRLSRQGAEEWMEIETNRLNGRDTWGPDLRGIRPGFYLIDSEANVLSVTFKGELDPGWLESAGVDTTVVVTARSGGRKAERDPTEADIAARQRVEAVRAGSADPAEMIALLGDAALLESVRTEAAKAMEERNEARVVPRLVPAMESEDELARRLAGQVVAKITGRSFGYRSDAPEDARRKAVQSLLEYIKRNPAKFK